MSEDKEKDSPKSENDSKADFPTLSHIGSVEEIGSQIGPYKLLSILGEGGMGLVYLAEQKEPVKRRVALKIIKPGMDSKQVIGRFEQERQALALLDHPNIAHIYDGGTTEAGHPYFVMEYVKGSPITKYCDKKDSGLNIEKRLELFEQVCEAVQHAHQKGIIHRDLKPSNILVKDQDGKPVPMIIDFGIAKATQPLTERTIVTKLSEPIGTVEYMSPEQAEMTIHGIDTRSDIYSLGVVLYELLTGTLPFTREELEKAGRAEIHRILRETDPPRPSTRLSSLGEEAKKVAERRQTEVTALTRRLHKELEWIPLKAMRKEPDRRYKTASELADDVNNYLNGDVLIAGPESKAYRVRKFAHRHTGLLISAALICVLSVVAFVGFVVSTTMYFRAEQAKNAEQEQRKLAEDKAEEYRRSLYVNRINLAEKYYLESNVSHVRELLRACPEDLREWEWYYLWRISDQSRMTLRGHSGNVNSVAFSPNGRRIVSSGGSMLKVWDANSFAELVTIRDDDVVDSAMFSPDGRRIVSVCGHSRLKVWDANTGSELRILSGYKSIVAFSPDIKRIVSRSQDIKRIFSRSQVNILTVWDVDSDSELITLRGNEGHIYSVAISPDGKRIVSGSFGTLKVWDAESGSELMTLKGHRSAVETVTFSPDGRRIVSGGNVSFRQT